MSMRFDIQFSEASRRRHICSRAPGRCANRCVPSATQLRGGVGETLAQRRTLAVQDCPIRNAMRENSVHSQYRAGAIRNCARPQSRLPARVFTRSRRGGSAPHLSEPRHLAIGDSRGPSGDCHLLWVTTVYLKGLPYCCRHPEAGAKGAAQGMFFVDSPTAYMVHARRGRVRLY